MSTPDSDSGPHNAEIDQLVEQYLELAKQGKAPAIDEYAREFPQHASELARVLDTVHVVREMPAALQPGGNSNARAGEAAPIIEDYRLNRVAGRGGMGVVYEAIQISLDRKVALKVLPQALFQNQRARQRFQLEAKAAAQLHHSNIVPVHDVGICNEHCYYTMQFIEGDTLDHVISQLRVLRGCPEDISRLGLPDKPQPAAHGQDREAERRFDASESDAARCLTIALSLDAPTEKPSAPTQSIDEDEDIQLDVTVDSDQLGSSSKGSRPARSSSSASNSNSKHKSSAFGSSSGNKPFFLSVARIGRQTAEALHYAHESSVVHRDIKPANLMLDTHGQVWITDFGLAKLGETNDLTRDGDVVGTLRYMAPERFDGKCDERSDIFSLGVTLYELLALQSPFDATDRMQLINQIKLSTPPSLRSLNRKVPYDLQTIVEKAMHAQPNRRYQSAGQLADDLARFCEGRPIQARRVGSAEKLWLWSKKNVGLAAALASLALLLILGTVGSTIAAFQFRASREEARAQSELAYDTLNQVLFDIQESLAEIPAASGARRRLLQTALEGLSKTSEQFVASGEVDRRLGVALQELSRLSLRTGTSGDHDTSPLVFAENAARRAVDISQKIVLENPDDSQAIRDLSISLACLGDVQRAKGEYTQARASYEEALDLSQRNLSRNQNVSQRLKDVAAAFTDLGKLESTALNHQVAIEHYQAADAYIAETLQATPDDRAVQRNAAIALVHIGNAHLSIEGQGHLAEDKLETALEQFQKLYDAQPESVRAQRDLSLALSSIANAYARSSKQAKRLAIMIRALSLAERMLALDPKNMDLIIGVAEAFSELGDVQNTLNNPQAALQSYARSREISEELFAAFPNSATVKKLVCMKTVLFAQLTRDFGNYDEASVGFKRARKIAEQNAQDPDLGDFYRRWVVTLDGMIEDCQDRKASGNPPEYWLEPTADVGKPEA